jgi:hypothetical protein
MPKRLSQRASADGRHAQADVERFGRGMDRVETVTRVFCVLAGLLLAAGAAVFFLAMVRIGGRALTAGVLGALFIGVAAMVLLQRGFTGKDPGTDSLRDFRFRRWF